MKFKKLVVIDSNDISEERLKEIAEEIVTYSDIPKEDEEVIKRIGDADAIIVDWAFMKPEIVEKCPNLKYMGGKFTGYGWFNWKEIVEKGITITSTPHYSKESVAEFTITQILNLLRRIKENEANFRTSEKVESNEAEGKILGIIGLGDIGKRVAEIAKILHMKIIYYSRTKKDTDLEYVGLDELLKRSDIVTLHCSLNEDSKGMIGAEQIRLMKDNSILINSAHTHVFKQDEIIPIIKEKKLKVAIDAFAEDEQINEGWFSVPNILLTPHVAYYTKESLERRNELTISNAKSFLEGNPQNVVN